MTDRDQSVVPLASMHDGVVELQGVISTMRERLDDLHACLAPLATSWSGTAAEEFETLRRRCTTSADDLCVELDFVLRSLRTAMERYETAERENRALWE